jgi:hypothetical protein
VRSLRSTEASTISTGQRVGEASSILTGAGTTRLQYFDLATRRSTTVARNLGDVFLGLTASSDGPHDFLFPSWSYRFPFVHTRQNCTVLR